MQEQNPRNEKSILKKILGFDTFYMLVMVLLMSANREIFDNVYAVSSYLLVMGIGFGVPIIFEVRKIDLKRKYQILILIGVCVCWFLTRPAYTENQAREQLFEQVGGEYQYLSNIRNGESRNYYYFQLKRKDVVYNYEVDPNTGSYRLIDSLTMEAYFRTMFGGTLEEDKSVPD